MIDLRCGDCLETMPAIDGGWRCILADPPWHFKSNSTARPGKNALRHYACMDLGTIAALPVEKIAADNAWLFMWITAPFLVVGAHLRIIRSWGFKTSTIGFVWDKKTFGTGYTTRSSCEFVVAGRRGQPVRRSKAVRQFIQTPAREHSRKPDEIFERIEELCDGPRLELFGRQTRPGWTVWGNETTKFNGGHSA